MSTKIELYGKLREHIPDETARAIAEEMPVESDLATKTDVGRVEDQLEKLELRIAAQMSDLKATLWRWQLMFFVPLWIGVYATLAAIVLRG